MLKWSVNNIPEMVNSEADNEVNTSTVVREEQEVDKELEQVNKRPMATKWKKLAYVMKFYSLRKPKKVVSI